MTYEQITNLLDKGFSPEMIMTLSGSNTTSSAPPPADDDKAGSDSSGTGDPPNGGEGGNAPPPSPTPSEDQQKTVPALDDVLKEMKELKASIQANNIKTQSVDTLKKGDSVEDVLASIIRPPMTNKEGK